MPNQPIGITFAPTAEQQANGPQQAGLEGQGGSDLTQAFKILSLHLPRVLGASAIAPKRLLTSQGSAGVNAPSGSSPYAAVFQALLQSLGGGGSMGGVDAFSSIYGSPGGSYGGGSSDPYGGYDAGSGGGGGYGSTGAPPPAIIPGSDLPRDNSYQPPPSAPPPSSGYGETYDTPYQNPDRYQI